MDNHQSVCIKHFFSFTQQCQAQSLNALVLTPHLVGTGRSALHVDTQEESSREHFISTALQNIIVKSLALNLNI